MFWLSANYWKRQGASVTAITFWSFSGGKRGYEGVTRRLCMVPVDDAGRNPHRSQKSIELEANRC